MKSMQTDYGQILQYGYKNESAFKEVRRSNLFWAWLESDMITWFKLVDYYYY